MSDDSSAGGIERLLGRRGYLQGVAGAGALATLGVPSVSASETELRAIGSRRDEAYNNRVNAANELIRELDEYDDQSNDDPISVTDDGQEYYYGAYLKGLGGSSQTHRIEVEVYDAFVDILENDGDYDDIDLGAGERRLVSPPAGHHFPTDGMDSWMGTMPAPPSFDSDLFGAELVELYWMEQFRDVTLGQYTDDSLYDDYEDDTDTLIGVTYDLDPEWVDLDNPFRGVSDHARSGPYLSQFLIQRASLGNVPMDPKVRPFEEGRDMFENNHRGQRSMMILGSGISSGSEPGDGDPDGANDLEEDEERWITTGRDLAAYVRVDPAYVPYVVPALQLFEWGAEFDAGLPNVDSDTVLQYVNYGGVGLLDLLARVTRNALNAAWYQKWLVHRRPRPEVASQTVQLDDPDDVMSDLVFDSTVYDHTAVEGWNTIYRYLSLTYREGSPAHPAYPSGHSAIGGACSTIVKAFFEDSDLLDLPDFETIYVPDGDGGRDELDENDTDTLTVHGEIDKLAENIGMGRLWAGVHYPTDHIYSVKLGEQVAIATLLDELVTDLNDSYEPIEDLTFTPFDADALDSSLLTSDGTAPVTIEVLEALREHAHNATP
ncbi:vanadium-dependent haloperoxidase [Natronobiforma cellulositropha]|uniref:vanadium-dependent haloperoxidase n=1 Tax=Natronobiforma cellulositropha TaxID=1679076 RepID=UPI0021D5D559|nr:vanadium-dependent haloperoxidase [Natronobiforma cellulositropha]